MTDNKLDDLEAACRVQPDSDGTVRLYPRDVLEIVSELRELRTHATARGVPVDAIVTMRRLAADFREFWERQPNAGVTVSNRIAVQDPGR